VLGDRPAARVAAEIGDQPEQYQTPNSLQCYAGKAPRTRCSGKSELVVACRLACNRYLAAAV
jgi:transposase